MAMMSSLSRMIIVVFSAVMLTSCAKNMNSNVYTEGSTPGKVLEGTVINARAVTIKAHDKLQDNTMGGVAGGAGGAAAGSAIGHGNGSIASAIGGAIVGAVAGAIAQDALSTQDGTEYLVKLDKKYIQEFKDMKKRVVVGSKTGVEQDMALSSNAATKTDIVSVVEATDPDIKAGSRVYIIYTDDRPHLVAQKQ